MNEIEVSLRAYAELRNEDAENYIACYGRGFHAGCSRYRPLVEQILSELKYPSMSWEETASTLIARIEKLMNESAKS